MRDRLMLIADSEGCTSQEKDLVDDILQQSGGDMRKAVTTLQSVHSLSLGGDTVEKEAIAEIAGLPPPIVVDKLWKAMNSPDFNSMEQAVEDVCADGYSAQLLLSALLPKLIADTDTSDEAKAEIALRMAEAEKKMIEGADEYLQLMTVCGLAVRYKLRAQQ